MKTTKLKLGLGSVIGMTTSIALFYMLSILLDLSLALIFGLLLTALAGTVWMAIRILKDSYDTDKTFDEYFYQDRPDIKRQWDKTIPG